MVSIDVEARRLFHIVTYYIVRCIDYRVPYSWNLIPQIPLLWPNNSQIKHHLTHILGAYSMAQQMNHNS